MSEDKLQTISAWLPGSDLRVRRLLLDAKDKVSAVAGMCGSAIR